MHLLSPIISSVESTSGFKYRFKCVHCRCFSNNLFTPKWCKDRAADNSAKVQRSWLSLHGGLVRTPELAPHRVSGSMIYPIYQWLEKNKLQSLKSQRKSQVVVVAIQLLSYVRLFETPWPAACQAPLFSPSPRVLKLLSVELVMPSNHLILTCKLLAKTKATSA